MIDKKKFLYTGQITVQLINNKFSFYERKPRKSFGIFYEAVKNKYTDEEKLSLDIKKSKSAASEVTMTLIKTNNLREKEEILEFSIGSSSFLLDKVRDGSADLEQTFQIFDKYQLRSDGKVKEAIFRHEDGCQFTVMSNPRSTLHDTYKWMGGAWIRKEPYVMHCLYVGNALVEESLTFSDAGEEEPVEIGVTERCIMTPVTGDNDPVVVPWRTDGHYMAEFLAHTLKIGSGAITLLGPDRRVIDMDSSFDESMFRSSNGREALTLVYDVEGAKVKCRSMANSDLIDVMIVGVRTVERVKERLSFKMATSVSRLIICRKDTLLSDEEGVSVDEELTFFEGHSPKNITRKVRIGLGGFGTVYRCTDETIEGEMALKTFDQPMDERMKCLRFREILVMTTLPSHDNIVGYMRVYIDNDEISIGMEYMPQGSLTKYIDKYIKEYERPFSEDVIRRLTRGIVHGLDHLHCNHIFHRDVKPDNVLLGENEVAKLCDFGLSKVLPDFSTNALYVNNTQTKEMGTFRWMAPEVMTWAPETLTGDTKKTRYSFKADIWSVGATVVQMITGEMPYYGQNDDTAINLIAKTRTIPYTPPVELSADLKEFVDACLKPNGEDRPTSAELTLFRFLNPE